MPRIKTKAITWKLTIDQTLAAQIELRLADLSRGRPIYGARSALVSHLLREWLGGTPTAQSVLQITEQAGHE